MDRQTVGVYDRRAAQYDKLVSRSTPDADLQRFIDAVPKGGRVLDLGCGPGNSAAMMRGAGLLPDAWDASGVMVETAARRYGIEALHKTFDDLRAVQTYDGIWANFSLLHAAREDMPKHLHAIHRALVPGGVFHIGLKTGDGAGRDGTGRLYTYYQEAALHGLLQEAGFTVGFTRHGRDKGMSGSVDAFMIVLAHA
ncbi:class I SAM-dependent methyltransferase [Nereida sp. MMG025]|uniref:class I SAM-dependent DNA methyltransferase n=1 Tax=Nereida sp. MMG025 TaxID=2909981 RepID=UPI001EF0C818|nr:class I SAM-dependent methyltransferase [Nereida sp. MMG025]